jgi:DNA-binding winged helix-turn-helix (wHTH) protein
MNSDKTEGEIMRAVADQLMEILAAAHPSTATRLHRCAADSSPEQTLVAEAGVSALDIVASCAESIGFEMRHYLGEVASALADREMRQRLQRIIQAYDLLTGGFGTAWDQRLPPQTKSRVVFGGGRVFLFGPFQLIPSQRSLLEGNRRVQIGGRAFDILTILVERAGEVVKKEELISRAWPNVFVEDGNLKTQVSGLRRALDESGAGRRYIATVQGHGYNFVAPVTCSEDPMVDGPGERRLCAHEGRQWGVGRGSKTSRSRPCRRPVRRGMGS